MWFYGTDYCRTYGFLCRTVPKSWRQHGDVGKGNRSQQVTDACLKYGGFYLGSIGGPAAILAQNNIKSIECVEYPELGMEAIWKIEVENSLHLS